MYCQFQNLHLEIPRALSLKFRDTTLSNPDRAQTTCQKDPPSVSFPPLSFTCLQIHRSTSCCLRAFTLLFDTCFPGSCASTSLVFTLTSLLPCRALSQGHRGSRLGRGVGSDRDVDIVRKDFPSHLGARLHSTGDSHSYKPKAQNVIWEAYGGSRMLGNHVNRPPSDSVPDPLCRFTCTMGLFTFLLQVPITFPAPWGTSSPKVNPVKLKLN